MDLIKVEPVCFQAEGTVLDGGHDIAAGAALLHANGIHWIAEFRRQNDVLAPVAQYLTHLGFRAAALAIGVGGVEQE